MGTAANSADEWIELYNNTNRTISLAGWGLYEAGGETLIEPLTGTIEAKSYYLIERTDDTTISDIPASQEPSSWSGYGFNNNGEYLQLLDNNSTLIDEVNCGVGWFAGQGKPDYKTKERKNPNALGNDSSNWGTNNGITRSGQDANGNSINGTPKAKNSVVIELPSPEEQIIEPEPPEETGLVEEPQPEPKPIIYPSGIVINEILPSAEGPDAEGEYIEIFNKNEEKANLSGWKIADAVGKEAKIYTFPEETIIEGEEFLVFYRSTTKIILNNDGDNVSLIQPGGKVDSVAYENAPKGESYNRIPSGWAWSTILTPGRENNILIQETEESEFVEEAAKIDINTAPLKDLIKIVHIGEAKAQELISLRPFYSLDELIRIKGISDEALEDIKTQGLAWVDPILEPPKIEKGTEPIEKGLAAVGEPFKPFEKQIPKSLSVFLIALALSIFSGIIILILKRKTY